MVTTPLFSVQFSYITSNDYPENLGHVQIIGNIFRIYNQSYCVLIIRYIMLCQYIISHGQDIYLPYPVILSTLMSTLYEDLDFLWQILRISNALAYIYLWVHAYFTTAQEMRKTLVGSLWLERGRSCEVTLQPAVLEHVLADTSHMRGHVLACVHIWFLYFLFSCPGSFGSYDVGPWTQNSRNRNPRGASRQLVFRSRYVGSPDTTPLTRHVHRWP